MQAHPKRICAVATVEMALNPTASGRQIQDYNVKEQVRPRRDLQQPVSSYLPGMPE
jgi:hypothetical protein